MLSKQPAGHACALVLVNLGCFVALQEDKDALSQLANEFEIDFVSLSFTRSREDVTAARDYLDSLGMVHTKVGLGHNPVLEAGSSRAGDLARHQLLSWFTLRKQLLSSRAHRRAGAHGEVAAQKCDI